MIDCFVRSILLINAFILQEDVSSWISLSRRLKLFIFVEIKWELLMNDTAILPVWFFLFKKIIVSCKIIRSFKS